MHSIDVDFDVFKALTVRRATEDVSYNDVIRELLGLINGASAAALPKAVAPRPQAAIATSKGEPWIVKGVTFPADTVLRANYKGKKHTARVKGGCLVLDDGPHSHISFTSPSAAAVAVTETSVNGWIFWEAKLPGRSDWALLDSFRRR